MSAIHFTNVSYAHTSAVAIIDDASFDLGPGWTGLVGANGAGKTTLLTLIAGTHPPDMGTIALDPNDMPPVMCPQRVDDITDDIVDFAATWDRDAVRLRASLALDGDDLERWPTMSPGERKRWQIATALAKEPDVLLLDEPTNHLDGEGHRLLEDALGLFKGSGVVVSHDRTLLNSLTTRTLRIAGGQIRLWSAPYDEAKAAWEAEAVALRDRHDALTREAARTRRRLADQRRAAEQKDATRIRERRTAGIHDLDTRGAVATGRHASGQGAGARERGVTRSKLESVTGEIASMDISRDHGGTIEFSGQQADKEFLVRYRGPVAAGPRMLFDVDVAIRRSDRIRIAGANGAGKTALAQTLLDHAAIGDERILSLPQEATAAATASWLDAVRSLPPAERGQVMALVSRLGTDPGPLLQSDQPSPGEARKVALALGLATSTWLVVLDEPTNHLDLPSIERLEEALTTYAGAVALISHDDRLAERVTDSTWTVGTDGVVVTRS